MLIARLALAVDGIILIGDRIGIGNLNYLDKIALSAILLTNCAIKNISPTATQASSAIQTSIAWGSARFTVLSVVGLSHIGVERTLGYTGAVEEGETGETLSAVMAIITFDAMKGAIETHVGRWGFEGSEGTVLLATVVVKVIAGLAEQTSGVVAVKTMRWAGVAGMSRMVGIESKWTHYQTFILHFEQSNHTVSAIISIIIATQTGRIASLAFEC